jgi:hypothetical protein
MMGKNLNPVGLQVWVWDEGTQTRKPMGFYNPVQHTIAVHINSYVSSKILNSPAYLVSY